MEPQQDQPERPSPTFRAEALAHRSRSRGPGGLIKLSPGWTNWAFAVIVVVFVAAVVAASVFRIDRRVPGVVANDAGRVVVLVPAAQVPGVPVGNPVELGGSEAEVRSFEGKVLYPPDIRERFGVDLSTPSVVVVTSATDGTAGERAQVLVESEPLIVAFVPGLKALFGDGDG